MERRQEELCGAFLSDRGILSIRGACAKDFLQRLVSQDLQGLTHHCSAYSLFLNPQGRLQGDFFVLQRPEGLWLEMDKERIPSLIAMLSMYALRQNLAFENLSDSWHVWACWRGNRAEKNKRYSAADPESIKNAFSDGLQVCFSDSRQPQLGFRIIAPKGSVLSSAGGVHPVSEKMYGAWCFFAGIFPQSSFQWGKSLPFDFGLHHLNSLSLTKGCYLGQELVARTLQRGQVRRHVFPAVALTSLWALDAEKKDACQGVTQENDLTAGDSVYLACAQDVSAGQALKPLPPLPEDVRSVGKIMAVTAQGAWVRLPLQDAFLWAPEALQSDAQNKEYTSADALHARAWVRTEKVLLNVLWPFWLPR